MSSGVAILVFSVGLIGAIMLHEWGHFSTARRFGMRADRFFLGFGPTIWSKQIGETEYGVKAIPAGGFVRIKGMGELDERLGPVAAEVFDADLLAADRRLAAASTAGGDVLAQPTIPAESWVRVREVLQGRGLSAAQAAEVSSVALARAGADASLERATEALEGAARQILDDEHKGVRSLTHRVLIGDEGRFFHDRPAWQRAIVLSAGSGMHFLQAFALLFLGLWLVGQTALPVISEVFDGTPAAEAGFVVGDEILFVDGEAIDDFDELSGLIRERGDVTTTFIVQRDDQELEIIATPLLRENPSTGEQYAQLGFAPEIGPLGFIESAKATVVGESSVPTIAKQTVLAIGQVFGPSGIGAIFNQVTGDEERDANGAVSVVGAARASGELTAVFGAGSILFLLASINVFVGIFNLLPLPPLDGGHLAVLSIEKAVNRIKQLRGGVGDFSIDPRAVAAVALPVIVFIGMISVSLIWLDIVNPASLVP